MALVRKQLVLFALALAALLCEAPTRGATAAAAVLQLEGAVLVRDDMRSSSDKWPVASLLYANASLPSTRTLRDCRLLKSGHEQNWVSAFKITDCQLELVRGIDRESVSECLDDRFTNPCLIGKLNLRAEGGVVVTLNVHVSDLNDNRPSFELTVQTLQMSEAATLRDSRVQLALAQDPDWAANAPTEYLLEAMSATTGAGAGAANPTALPFQLELRRHEETGYVMELALNVSGELDRELCDRYTMRLLAVDGRPPQSADQRHTATATIHVIVTDYNDRPPIFSKTNYQLAVSESLAKKNYELPIHVQATDDDIGPNSAIEYSLVGEQRARQYVRIEPRSGALTLLRDLDFEQANERTLVLRILARDSPTDGPRLSATATLTINVLDVDDNPPVAAFKLHSEAADTVDVGTQPLRIEENRPPGSVVAVLNAKDADITPAFHTVSCLLEPIGALPPPPFKLWPVACVVHSDPQVTCFELRTTRELDRDQPGADSYAISIRCQSGAAGSDSDAARVTSLNTPTKPPNVSLYAVHIEVLDVNDNAPVFERAHERLERDEDHAQRPFTAYPLVNMRATDVDSGANGSVRYSLLESSGNRFGIGENSGLITVLAPLDREQQESISLVVLASDRGTPPRTSTATIELHLRDLNDNAPVVAEAPSYSVYEGNITAPIELGRVNASDLDAGANGEVECVASNYSAGSSVPTPLEVSSDCRVTLRAGVLDREAHSQHRLGVIVRDRGSPPQSTHTEVVLEVRDVNEHAPEFLVPNLLVNSTYTITLSQRTPFGRVIMKLRANDPDEGENARVEYRLLSVRREGDAETLEPQPFALPLAIHLVTGDLLVNSSLENCQIGFYVVTLTASDRGVPPLSTTAKVRVELSAEELVGDLYGTSGFSLLRRPYLSLVMLAGILVVFVCMSAILVTTIVVLARKQHQASSREASTGSPDDSPTSPGSTGATNSPATGAFLDAGGRANRYNNGDALGADDITDADVGDGLARGGYALNDADSPEKSCAEESSCFLIHCYPGSKRCCCAGGQNENRSGDKRRRGVRRGRGSRRRRGMGSGPSAPYLPPASNALRINIDDPSAAIAGFEGNPARHPSMIYPLHSFDTTRVDDVLDEASELNVQQQLYAVGPQRVNSHSQLGSLHELHAELQPLARADAQQRGRRRVAHEESGLGAAKPTDSFSEDSGKGVSESGALRLNGASHARALSNGQNPRLLHLTQGDSHRNLSSSVWPVIAPATGDSNNNKMSNTDYVNHESTSPFPPLAPTSRARTPRTPDALPSNRTQFPADSFTAEAIKNASLSSFSLPASVARSGGTRPAAALASGTGTVYTQLPYGEGLPMQSVALVHGKLSVPIASGAGTYAMGMPNPASGFAPGPTTPIPLHEQLAATRSDITGPLQMQELIPRSGGLSMNINNPPLSYPYCYPQPLHQYPHNRDLYANRVGLGLIGPEQSETSYRFPGRAPAADNATPSYSQADSQLPGAVQPDTQQRWGVRAARVPLTLRSLTPMPALHTRRAPNPKRPCSAGIPRDQEDEHDGDGLHEKGRCSPVDEVPDPDAADSEDDSEYSPARQLQSFANIHEATGGINGDDVAKRSLNMSDLQMSARDSLGVGRGNMGERALPQPNEKDPGKLPNSNSLRQNAEREVDASTVKRLLSQYKQVGSTRV